MSKGGKLLGCDGRAHRSGRAGPPASSEEDAPRRSLPSRPHCHAAAMSLQSRRRAAATFAAMSLHMPLLRLRPRIWNKQEEEETSLKSLPQDTPGAALGGEAGAGGARAPSRRTRAANASPGLCGAPIEANAAETPTSEPKKSGGRAHVELHLVMRRAC